MRLWHFVSQAFLATPNTQDSHSATPIDSLSTTTMASKNSTIYFGYGSNLWRHQMDQRCPTSEYLGIARLNDYKWIINERGYANVVQMNDTSSLASDNHHSAGANNAESHKDEVWGLVYTLQANDEQRLDRNEGVPIAYTKEFLGCDFWAVENGSGPANVSAEPERVEMLVYINREMIGPSDPKQEYIYRMNMGIRDAVKEGVPKGYVRDVMRKFIPEGEDGMGEVEDEAKRQAAEFEDER
ncbi:hypothetical protein Q7P37_005796 [Cladosporium fusiforme]